MYVLPNRCPNRTNVLPSAKAIGLFSLVHIAMITSVASIYKQAKWFLRKVGTTSNTMACLCLSVCSQRFIRPIERHATLSDIGNTDLTDMTDLTLIECITNFRFTTGYFSLRSKCALWKGFLGPKLFLKIKIENFYLQKQLRSDRFSFGTPFFS